MPDLLVSFAVIPSKTINATASYTTPALNMRWIKEASLLVRATSGTGNPDVKIEYAVSKDGTNFGSFNDYTDLVASSAAFATPQGITAVALPNMLAPFIELKATGIGGNPADTVLDVTLVGREKL